MHHEILREQTGTVSELQDTSVSVFVFAGHRRQVTASGHTKKRDINQAQSPTTTWTKPHRHYLGSPAGKPSIHTNALLSASVSEPAETETKTKVKYTDPPQRVLILPVYLSVTTFLCSTYTTPSGQGEWEGKRESDRVCVREGSVRCVGQEMGILKSRERNSGCVGTEVFCATLLGEEGSRKL